MIITLEFSTALIIWGTHQYNTRFKNHYLFSISHINPKHVVIYVGSKSQFRKSPTLTDLTQPLSPSNSNVPQQFNTGGYTSALPHYFLITWPQKEIFKHAIFKCKVSRIKELICLYVRICLSIILETSNHATFSRLPPPTSHSHPHPHIAPRWNKWLNRLRSNG